MRTIVIGSSWVGLSFSAFLLKPSVYVPLAGTLPFGLVVPASNAAVVGYRTAIAPDRLMGRVGSVARTIALCMAPLGPLSAGLMLHWLSARETVAVYAACMLVLCVVVTTSRSIRNAPSLSELDDLPTRTTSPAEAG